MEYVEIYLSLPMKLWLIHIQRDNLSVDLFIDAHSLSDIL